MNSDTGRQHRGRRDHQAMRRPRCSRSSAPTAIGCLSSKPTRRFPPNMCCLVHYLGETPNLELERKIGVYLRRIQGEHGGWPLYHAGAFDISRDGEGLFRAEDDRRSIRRAAYGAGARREFSQRGGADKANVFTRILLALYGEMSWNNVPTVPVELILLPRWFPIHLSKMSYWARTVIVPLLVLAALKPLARNPRGVHVRRTVRAGCATCASKRAPHQNRYWAAFFGALDWLLEALRAVLAQRIARARHRAMRALVDASG